MGVYRCYATKKVGFDTESRSLFNDIKEQLGLSGLTDIKIFNRYDVEGVTAESYAAARRTVFSEPPCDDVYDEELPALDACRMLAVEALPGQFDQRADSTAACIQLLCGGDRPVARYAKVYAFFGELTQEQFEACKAWLINPVECREASSEKPSTLIEQYPAPAPVPVLEGFIGLDRSGLEEIVSSYGLAMDLADITFLQDYFRKEGRDPTETELRVLDTYWSDHCRHTTFLTRLEADAIEDEDVNRAFSEYLALRDEVYGERISSKPVTLMDIATIGAKALKKRGLLKNLDESDEINACTVKIKADIDGQKEDWLLLFKNETHNHPTEIEPFGGAATCLGGAIRDPLSGRAYVYQAMRVTGSGDPRQAIADTLPGKLPQKKITRTAAAGYSSYGNQIGLATGLVDEVYHPGYVAKRLEIGAVVGAAPAKNVVRLEPAPGDIVIVLGGRTGRDGCGGATGSSKSHSKQSLTTCGAEVQKGNPPEERKLQRLFRDPEVSSRIKRCNDFGAGGVSVAIGELADGLRIDLSVLPKKYEGLTGTELAISESQERMAVVVDPSDAEYLLTAAAEENIEATPVAVVTAEPRLVMELGGRRIVDISREFLGSNGAPKSASFSVPELPLPETEFPHVCGGPAVRLKTLMASLPYCSRRGLTERFDGSIGAGSVLMPYGGATQSAPTQVMAALIPVTKGKSNTCSVMSYGFDPLVSAKNPYLGSISAVTVSLAKLAAAGCDVNDAYFTFQEYFERLRKEPARWGKPVSALLGALEAQLGYGVAAIGGKDSMSGSFDDLDVPPTLVSFAIAVQDADKVISPEFKSAGNGVYVFSAPYSPDGRPLYGAVKEMWRSVAELIGRGEIVSARALEGGGLAETVVKMALGNNVGFELDDNADLFGICTQNFGGIVVEAPTAPKGAVLVGRTIAEPVFRMRLCPDTPLCELLEAYEGTLSEVFPISAKAESELPKPTFTSRNTSRPAILTAKPKAVIPVFPGTNCEYDTARAVERAGGEAEILLVRNLTPETLRESARRLEAAIRKAQMLVIPGGFSGGDEPEGSGKFITAFFKYPALKDAVEELLGARDGLALGICNGFQALIKLGLVPFGHIRDTDADCPTLTYNSISRHQSRYVTTRVASVKSPWLSLCEVDELHAIPISHGEGRFVASPEMLSELIANGQVAFQYCDNEGNPSMDTRFNPNGSLCAIEGITSPDGRVLGKMGHTERSGDNIAKNIPGNKLQPIFESGVRYFK